METRFIACRHMCIRHVETTLCMGWCCASLQAFCIIIRIRREEAPHLIQLLPNVILGCASSLPKVPGLSAWRHPYHCSSQAHHRPTPDQAHPATGAPSSLHGLQTLPHTAQAARIFVGTCVDLSHNTTQVFGLVLINRHVFRPSPDTLLLRRQQSVYEM